MTYWIAGGMIGTTDDLRRFFTALIGGRLLRPAQLAEMEKTIPVQEPGFPGARYGLGLMWIPLSCGGGYYGHAGDLPGYQNRNGITADGRRFAIVSATGDLTGPATEEVLDTLIDQQLCGH